jgi:inhibitor of KinA
MFKHINQISEQSFLINFGDEINLEVSNIVNLFAKKIINDHKNIEELKILNCVPSYNKILIQFDPLLSNKKKIIYYLKSIKIETQKKNKDIIIDVPICYDDTYALDIQNITYKTNLTKNAIIKEHLNTLFHVYLIGFLPGLPFLGSMNKKFSLSRKSTPRIKVPRGSVGIVNQLCVIYPQESPGGWNIIGRTPINFFLKNKKNPLIIRPGYKVKFRKISAIEFNNYDL